MKIVKINDDLKINIEQIYSLERTDNQNDINTWNNNYEYYLNEYSQNPITLPISDDKVFTPEFGKENDPEDLKLYMDALHNHILTIIGSPPKYVEKFCLLLITGLKINIDKTIYDKINKYLEQFE